MGPPWKLLDRTVSTVLKEKGAEKCSGSLITSIRHPGHLRGPDPLVELLSGGETENLSGLAEGGAQATETR